MSNEYTRIESALATRQYTSKRNLHVDLVRLSHYVGRLVHNASREI